MKQVSKMAMVQSGLSEIRATNQLKYLKNHFIPANQNRPKEFFGNGPTRPVTNQDSQSAQIS